MLLADTFSKHLISAYYVTGHEGKKMNKKYFFPWRSSWFSGPMYCKVLKMSASDGLLFLTTTKNLEALTFWKNNWLKVKNK